MIFKNDNNIIEKYERKIEKKNLITKQAKVYVSKKDLKINMFYLIMFYRKVRKNMF